MNEKEYQLIFKLIDDSNLAAYSADSDHARRTLYWKNIYNADGELVTNDKRITKYYEDNWC
jgi:hypothetical protein